MGWHDTRTFSKRITKRQRTTRQAASNNIDAVKQTHAASSVLDLSALAQGAAQKSEQAPAQLAPSNSAASITYVHITCDDKKVLIETTTDDTSSRQQFVFNQPERAHAAFLQHIARFEAKGFIENKGA